MLIAVADNWKMKMEQKVKKLRLYWSLFYFKKPTVSKVFSNRKVITENDNNVLYYIGSFIPNKNQKW